MGATMQILALLVLFFVITVAHPSSALAESTSVVPPSAGKVLVLGAGGFLGRYLTHALHQAGYDTITVDNRTHADLRNSGSLEAHLISHPSAWGAGGALNVSYCFFLACEVGGSRFIASPSPSIQASIAHSNALIYSHVFPWLRNNSIPFLFTSSVLQGHMSPYGAVKRLGEAWVTALGHLSLDHQRPLGISVRLWNLFGRERPGSKAHVLSDWLRQCLLRRQLSPLTNGHETRRFLHASDAASALISAMRAHGIAGGAVADIVDPAAEPVRLRDLVPLVAAAAGAAVAEVAEAMGAVGTARRVRDEVDRGVFCPAQFPDIPAATASSDGSKGSPGAPPPSGAVPAAVLAPGWRARVSLEAGLLDAARAAAAAIVSAGRGTDLIEGSAGIGEDALGGAVEIWGDRGQGEIAAAVAAQSGQHTNKDEL